MNHTFEKASDYNLLSPEFCNQCHELIIGVFTPVYRCRNCPYVVHDECLLSAESARNCRESLADSLDESSSSAAVITPVSTSVTSSSTSSPAVLVRKPSSARPIRHHLVRGNLAVDATCVVCERFFCFWVWVWVFCFMFLFSLSISGFHVGGSDGSRCTRCFVSVHVEGTCSQRFQPHCKP